MKRILVVIGTRPEAIKLFPVVHALRDNSQFECIVCTTGQHREMVDEVLDFAGVVPDYRLDAMRAGQSLDALTARLVTAIGRAIDVEPPDWVVVQGDTASAFTGALASYYRRIRVCHVEAGLRTGDIYQPWPEEVNRRMIATMAALHCAPTESAAKNLRREGIAEETISVTGNTVIDALQWTRNRLEHMPGLAGRMREIEKRFAGRRIVAVTCHRRENWGHGMEKIAEAVRRIADLPDVAIVFPLHPNPLAHAVFSRAFSGRHNIVLIDPLPYPDFVRLIELSQLMLTDSGGIQEEASSLGTPLLVMRETTERLEGLSLDGAKLVGSNADQIFSEALARLCKIASLPETQSIQPIYGNADAAQYICQLLHTKINIMRDNG